MKQSEAKDFLPLIQAWSEGKTVQIKYPGTSAWTDMDPDNPRSFFYPPECYRIKPEPRTFYAVEWPSQRFTPVIAKNLEEAVKFATYESTVNSRVITLREVLDE